MALWLLGMTQETSNEFRDSFCFCRGLVIRADSQAKARAIAKAHGAEHNQFEHEIPWMCPDKTTCERIDEYGPDMVILTNWQGE